MKKIDKRIMLKDIQENNYRLHQGSYLISGTNRLFSYKHQVELAVESKPNNILIIGKGDGIVENIIASSGIKVITVDIDRILKPNIVASVEYIPLHDNSIDVCLCCEVLEHLHYNSFEETLKELYRVTKNILVLSLPDIRRFLSLRLIAPKLNLQYQVSLPRLRKRKFPKTRTDSMGHYWEIGFRDYDFGNITNAIEAAGWKIDKTFRVHDMQWHTFFYCKKKFTSRLSG